MAFREEIQKRLDKKKVEIAALESQLALARAYAQALEDTIKIAPREGGALASEPAALRPGTLLAKTRQLILDAGKPLRIEEILKGLGLEDTKRTRVSLVGSLGSYVRTNKFFNRPRPNVFGLIDMPSELSEEDRRLKVA